VGDFLEVVLLEAVAAFQEEVALQEVALLEVEEDTASKKIKEFLKLFLFVKNIYI
jgi:hypothetical protein